MSLHPLLALVRSASAAFALLFTCVAGAALPGSAVVDTGQVRAELVAHAPEGVQPGAPVWLGLKIEHAPHWHTYWRNPGDSGLPTTLSWSLPQGVTAGDIQWPTPSRLPVGPLMNFGYEGTVLLAVPLAVPPGFNASALDVRLQADWLVCKTECIPESGVFTLRLPAGSSTALHAGLFEAARASVPAPVSGVAATAHIDGDALRFEVAGLPPTWHGRTAEFFPETLGVIENAAPVPQSWEKGVWQARVALSAQRSESPAVMPVVLAFGPGQGVQVQAAVQGDWPAAAPRATVSPALQAALDENLRRASGGAAPVAPAAAPLGWGLALAFALLGGLLLNLMPCVFPVLSLKVLGFAQHAHRRGELAIGGFAYTAGVVISFVALAGALLALRAAGEQLGWGFQLQSPGFVAALALLFTLIGLNLAGVFEFGSFLPSRLATLQARHPAADAFLTGVLAVAIASPCTAPFMGASLGAAAAMPAPQALSVFAALGLGMALPYLGASLAPALARALPRPGPWMVRFKGLMAFPMFATVVWLVWVLGQQVGIDAVAGLLGVLVVLALVVWAWGSPAMAGRARSWVGVPALVLAALAVWWAAPAWREPPPAGVAQVGQADGWEPWSPQRVAELTAQGRPVFVDFTAAWCVTCQFNKRTTLADARVLEAFAQRRVALLRADWTSRDATISAALAALGRHGVPVYVLHPPGPGQRAPLVLSEILTVQEVRAAVASL